MANLYNYNKVETGKMPENKQPWKQNSKYKTQDQGKGVFYMRKCFYFQSLVLKQIRNFTQNQAKDAKPKK